MSLRAGAPAAKRQGDATRAKASRGRQLNQSINASRSEADL
jgi:hypothetical protein